MVQARTFEKHRVIFQEIITRDTGAEPDKAKKTLDDMEQVLMKSRRQPAPAPPPGGISQSKAARKYKVHSQTISRWAAAGYVPILLKSSKEVYVDEAKLFELVTVYRKRSGRGKKTIRRIFNKPLAA
jgi:hypothetical protein